MSNTESMIERVARAIYSNCRPSFFRSTEEWEDLREETRLIFRDHARVAIKAMREPDIKMRTAGFGPTEGNDPCRIYQSMIDAALDVVVTLF